MEMIYSWVKNIVIYIILITVVMNLLGKSSYKKYIGIFTGMILVMLVVSPLIKFFNIENIMDYYFESNNLNVEANDVSNQMIEKEKEQNDAILKEYKQKLADQINNILSNKKIYPLSIQVEIEEDKKSSDFGLIKYIQIVASHSKEESEDVNEKEIEKINIEKIDLEFNNEEILKEENEDGLRNKISSLEETELKNTLADFYNVSIDNINISIQE